MAKVRASKKENVQMENQEVILESEAKPKKKAKSPLKESDESVKVKKTPAKSSKKSKPSPSEPVLENELPKETPEEGPVPEYSLGLEQENTQNTEVKVPLSKVLPLEAVVTVFQSQERTSCSEISARVATSVLRGQDILAFEQDQEIDTEFLFSAVSLSQILSGSLTRAEARQPLVVVLAQSEDYLSKVSQSCSATCASSNMQVCYIKNRLSEEDKKALSQKHIDVLFVTPSVLNELLLSDSICLNSVGLCFAVHIGKELKQNQAVLKNIFDQMPQERVQKVFICDRNTPELREFSSLVLKDPEVLRLKPHPFTEHSIKQFAHALTMTQKFQVLLGHLKTHKPNCAVVLVNSKPVAEWVAYKLHKNQIKVECVLSELDLHKKQKVLDDVKNGKTNVIVSTDFGIKNFGIASLNCIYHFDIPSKSDQFIERLSLIEGSRLPISIAFICEEYGYNMGKIEQELGFKIRVVHVDKNYFQIPDESDYPLQDDGRVKPIESVQAVPAQEKTAPIMTPTTSLASAPKLHPRPTVQTPEVRSAPQNTRVSQDIDRSHLPKQGERPHASASTAQRPMQREPFVPKNQEKFVRRDDRAFEAIDGARTAALEKKKVLQTNVVVDNASVGSVFSLAVHLVQDALKAATKAAKDSLSANLEQNKPLISSVMKKIPFLTKEKK